MEILDPSKSTNTFHSVHYNELKQKQQKEVTCFGCFRRSLQTVSHLTYSVKSLSIHGHDTVATSTGRSSTMFHESDNGGLFVNAESQFFFDAEEDGQSQDLYPVATTDLVKSKPHEISLSSPESLLGTASLGPEPSSHPSDSEFKDEEEQVPLTKDENEDNTKRKSGTFTIFRRLSRNSGLFGASFSGRNRQEAPNLEMGYPGALTEHELKECVSNLPLGTHLFRHWQPSLYILCRLHHLPRFIHSSHLFKNSKSVLFHQSQNWLTFTTLN